MLLHRFKRMPVNTPAVLNSFIIHVSFPALILLSVHDLKISGEVGLMAAMGWIVFALSAGFFWLIGRWLDLPRPTLGITFAGIYSSGRPGVGEMAKRIFLFPPFIALVIALLLIPMEYPEWLT